MDYDTLDKLAIKIFGHSLIDAHEKNICVSCRKKANHNSFTSEKSLDSYLEDGLCQECQDELEEII